MGFFKGKKGKMTDAESNNLGKDGETEYSSDSDSTAEGESRATSPNLDDFDIKAPGQDGRASQEFSNTSNSGSSSEELARCQAELAETKDKYLRAMADFENYKKRVLKERSEMLRYEGINLVADVLEVLDNLELALGHAAADPGKILEGLKMVHKQFVDVLGKWQVKGESAIGKDFDPKLYGAISQIEAPDKKPGTIVGELRKAFFYKDKLVRPGEVVVVAAATEPKN